MQTIFIMDDDGRFRIPARKITAAIVVIPAGEPAPLPELAAGPCGRVGANTAYFCLIVGYDGIKRKMTFGRRAAYFGGCPETIPIRGMQQTSAPIPAVDWHPLRNALAGGAA